MSGYIPAALVAVDWQALATFLTGFMAVGAAMWVGTKQTAIQNRQTDLAENAIKVDLLDRRIACIEKIRDARVALTLGGTENFREHAALYEAIKVAEFLFPEAAVKPIRDISDVIYKAENANRLIDAMERRGDEPGRLKAIDRFFELDHQIWDALPSLEAELVAATRIVLDD